MLLTRNRFIVQQDTPSSYSGQTGLFTRVNAGEDALEFAAAGGVFLGLSDTPSSYSGQTGLFTRVNAAEDALEFAAAGGAGVDDSCLVRNVANQSIPNSITTIITWDTEVYDTDGMHDPAVNPSRITIQTAGKYLVYASCEYQQNGTGEREVNLLLNAAISVVWTIQGSVSNGATASFNVMRVMDLSVGDFIEVRAFQTSGAALDWLGSGIGISAAFGAIKILG